MSSGQRFSRRDLLSGGSAAAAMAVLAAPSTQVLAAVQATAVDVDRLIHPELVPAAAQMRDMAKSFPPLSASTIGEFRQGMTRWKQPLLPDVPVEKRGAPVGTGEPEVAVYVVNARPGSDRPAILHTHGGGYFMGAADQDVPGLQKIARELDCVCVTVDYTLAPEARWRTSTKQNYAGLKWLYQHAGELGVDRSRIALLGESAGGGHAALLAIAARDRGEVPLVAQVLVYPMLDDRTASTHPVPAHIGSLVWTGEFNRFGWRSFLGVEPGAPGVPSAAVPARAHDLAGLPPAFIGVGAIDLFVEEDVEYAHRLIRAGVPTELLVVPGAFHGFDMIAAETRVAREFTAAKLGALKRAFGIAPGA